MGQTCLHLHFVLLFGNCIHEFEYIIVFRVVLFGLRFEFQFDVGYSTSWWSDTMSALGRLLKLVAHLFHLLLIIIMKSILLWVLRSGDSHIHSLLVLFGLNMVFVMHRLFVAQKVSSFSPQGFTFPNPNFPMTFSHWVSSSPTFAFKSPLPLRCLFLEFCQFHVGVGRKINLPCPQHLQYLEHGPG